MRWVGEEDVWVDVEYEVDHTGGQETQGVAESDDGQDLGRPTLHGFMKSPTTTKQATICGRKFKGTKNKNTQVNMERSQPFEGKNFQ